MAFAVTPTEITADMTGETAAVVLDAVQQYRDAAAASAAANDWIFATDAITAAAGPFGAADALWDGLVRTRVGPAIGAEFIALSARKHRRPHPATAGRLQWPAGMDGPATVEDLFALYPTTFAGVEPGAVSAIIVSPTWQAEFTRHMTRAVNLVKDMPETAFRDMQARLLAVADEGIFEKQRAVRAFLSWDDEGGYAGWMRRAERIARTEIQAARQASAYAAALSEAEDGRPMKKVWHAALDERVRDPHREAHKQERPLDAPFNVGGEPLDYPGDREHGSTWNTINCRCGVSYVGEEYSADDYPDLNEMTDSELEDYMQSLTADGAAPVAANPAWEGRLAPLGAATGDGRLFAPDGTFRFRAFPLPLLWQETTGEGHDASRIVGSITEGEITPDGITGRGIIYADESKVLALLRDGLIRPSVDLCDVVADLDDDGTFVLHEGTVMAATLVATPAFEDVSVTLTGEDREAPAAESVLASAAALDALPTYPAAAFDDPALPGPTPVTVDRDTGRVVGHLALWDSCHVGLPGRCVQPPRSASNYAAFHQSTVITPDGDRLAVGRLTVGGGHADARAGVRAAAEHYDTTGACWAFVRAGEDEHGIWVAGQINPAATAEQLAAAEAAPLSGDWRRVGAGLELVAALSVSTPGFPVRREYSAAEGALDSLVAAASPVARCGDDPADSPAPPDDGAAAFERGRRFERAAARFRASEQQALARRVRALDERMGGA